MFRAYRNYKVKVIVVFVLVLGMLFSNMTYVSAKNYNRKDIKRIEHYLNNITTFIAYFTQDVDDNISSGKFYLQKKGKIGKFRWEYYSPTHLIVVVNGNKLSYHDVEINEVSYSNVDDLFTNFLVKPNLKLEKDLDIKGLTKSKGFIELTFLHNTNGEVARMVLKFSDSKKLQLAGLDIYNVSNSVATKIIFEGSVEGKSIDKKLFVINKK